MDNNNDSDSEYEIKQEIGKGNFGKVLLGISKKTGKKVAIKIINKLKLSKRYNSEQIKREINVIQQMDHLNIVKIYKIENDVKKYKIIMEYCEKGELYEYIVKKKRLNEDESACYYFQLINGVEFIHSKNIVHRDLKPENLLINKKNILKIIDFGLCNYHNINKFLSTPCGSPSYASPEMVSGKKYNGILVDIWCTGIILFAMLCGYLPFEANDNYSLFKKIIKCEIKYPTDLSNISLDLLKKIIVNDPAKRITIPEIKKHPFYLKGKKVFGRMHKEFLKYLEISISPTNDSLYNKYKKYKKKKIYLIKNKNKEKDKNIYNSNGNINDFNSKYKKTIDDSMNNQKIICFDISIEKNNKRKVFDDEYLFNKEKIFKKKNILKKKPITQKNSLTKINSDEIIKGIKPIMSPKNRAKKIKFKEELLGRSFKEVQNLNLNYSVKNANFKTVKYNISPKNSFGPYKRPTLKERSISLKKVKYNNKLINPKKTIISSKNSIKKKNITLNGLSGKNSVIVNKLFHIKNNGKNNNLIISLYVYKHKTLNKSEIKDNNYIYEKKHQISKNSLEKNVGRNNSNDLNIYYILGNSQTKKKYNIKSKIIYLNNLNQNILNNYKIRNTYTNIKMNPVKKYSTNNPNIYDQSKNNDKIYPHIYWKTIDIPQNINEYNSMRESFNRIDNHQKDNNESIVSNPNNRRMIRLLNSQGHLLFNRPIKKEETLLYNSENYKSVSTLAGNSKYLNNKIIPKTRFNAVILNNQINQLNIYKNDNSTNTYNVNSINFYHNSHILKTEENDLNKKDSYKGRNEFNTITVNKRYETENNDYQSIFLNTNRPKRKIYRPILNKNALKKISINKHKIKRKKLNLENSLNLKEDNNKFIIKNNNKNKLVLGDNNSLIDKKYKDNNLPISIKFDNINNEEIIKKKKDYFKKNNVLNIHY